MQINLDFLFYALAGLVGGVVGGMGMGGGTLLIPALTVFLHVGQKTAQAINLLSFLPMSVVALVIHHKNGLIKTAKTGWLIVPAVFSGAGAAFLAHEVEKESLAIYFGCFLIVVGTVLLAAAIKNAFFGGEKKKPESDEKEKDEK